MIKILLAKWKFAAIVLLLIAFSATLYQCRAEVQNAAQWSMGFHQLEGHIESLQQEAIKRDARWHEQTERQRTLSQQLLTIHEERQQMTEVLMQMERTDEEVADWSGNDLPCSFLSGRLREQAASRCDRDSDGVRGDSERVAGDMPEE